MAEETPKKKKPGKLPYGALLLTTVGAAALVRAFWNPHRAVVKDGYTSACEGAGCSPYMVIDSATGGGPVYSGARGLVVKADKNSIWIVPNREAVVLEYVGEPLIQSMVREGQTVWQGEQIAQAARVKFAVFRMDRGASGKITYTPLSPSAWLASRGLRISSKRHAVSAEGDNWCEGGRKLMMPEGAFQCGLRLPQPSAVALLPITVNTA